ncbi:DUF2156 domain-containing protein [bacterium]|nr:MAG: DUF2156 domain-containing protein [bacterium]
MLKQFVPSDFCLKCQGCCRFARNPGIWAPAGCRLVRKNGEYICANLREDNHCEAYSCHPLDCQLYPFLLVRHGNSLRLGLHRACSFITEHRPQGTALKGYIDYLKERLQTDDIILALQNNPEIAADYRQDVEIIADVSDLLNAGEFGLRQLTIEDKPLVESYLQKNKTNVSSYHFAGIFIWSGLYKIFWTIIQDNLCIFYSDAIGMFMPIPPLGVPPGEETILRCFELMNSRNQNNEISRIENVSETDLKYYEQSGFKAKLKDKEYLCLRDAIAKLSGEAFKHKRASYNHFKKNYKAQVLKYNDSLCQDCLSLYRLWMKERKGKFSDSIYQQMLEDSFVSFETALKFYEKLDLIGYAVKIDGKIRACSFGYALNEETFCVLFEVCDLECKGAAQFIFSEFCQKLSGYKYTNIMGTSDLKNLEKLKLSYRPAEEVALHAIYQ